MKTERTGLILYVKEYKKCVLFYDEVLNLSILFQNEELTCFDFYGTYLMVEKEDRPEYLEGGSEIKNYSCLRINVDDVKSIAEERFAKQIEDYKK